MSIDEIQKAAISVNIVILAKEEWNKNSDLWKILLVQRKNDSWVLPGGFVDKKERLSDAALRGLYDDTCVSDVKLHQFGTFGDPNENICQWTLTIGYLGFVSKTSNVAVNAVNEAKDAQWFYMNNLPKLTEDTQIIIKSALVMSQLSHF